MAHAERNPNSVVGCKVEDLSLPLCSEPPAIESEQTSENIVPNDNEIGLGPV